MRQKGSITVFVALSFTLILAMIVGLVESARVQGARIIVAASAQMALDNLFAEYERQLLDDYGVMLFDGSNGGSVVDEDYLKNKIKGALEYGISPDNELILYKGTDFYRIDIDDVEIEQIIRGTDAGGLIWRNMTNQYAKLDYSVKLFEDILGIKLKEQENEVVKKVIEDIDSGYETASNISNYYLQLIEHLDGIVPLANGIDFSQLKISDTCVKKFTMVTPVTKESVSINDDRVYIAVYNKYDRLNQACETLKNYFNDPTISPDTTISLFNYVAGRVSDTLKDNEECIRLIDHIIDSNQMLGNDTDMVENELTYSEISDESRNELQNELDYLKQCYKQNTDKSLSFDEYKSILNNNVAILSAVDSKLTDIRNIIDVGGKYHLVAHYDLLCYALEPLEGYRTDGLYLNYEGLDCVKGNLGILGAIYDFASEGIVMSSLPEDIEVSKKKIDWLYLAEDYLPYVDRDKYVENIANYMSNELLFYLYIIDKYSCFTDNDTKGSLDYEIEYMIFGNKSDKDNLKAAFTSIAGIRLASNIASIFLTPEMKNEAYMLALSALGVTGMMPVVKGLQYLILIAWAIAETIMDLRLLARGDRIVFFKRRNDWTLTLDNVISGQLLLPDTKKDKGFDYKEYLVCLMLLSDGEKLAYRNMSIVELNMISLGADTFRLNHYIYGMEIKITYYVNGGRKKYIERCSYTY